jgi:hypothetical protein
MWKANWEETKAHFIDWWNREGLVIGMWGGPPLDGIAHDAIQRPPRIGLVRDRFLS